MEIHGNILTKNLELGNRRDSAFTLEYMDYGYFRRGDYINAYSAYKAAVDSYLGTVDEEPHCTRCKDNMAKIKDMLRDPDLNIGFERPREDINWPTLFYPGAILSRTECLKTGPSDPSLTSTPTIWYTGTIGETGETGGENGEW